MKKKSVMAALCMLIMLGALLLCLIASGVIVFDHSSQRRGEGVFWQGVLYVPCSGAYNEGKTIAKTDGMINGTWYITTEIAEDQYNEDGSPKAYTVWCYTIPGEYVTILEKYLK